MGEQPVLTAPSVAAPRLGAASPGRSPRHQLRRRGPRRRRPRLAQGAQSTGRGTRAVRQAADDMGYRAPGEGARIVPGQVERSVADPESFRTTSYNPAAVFEAGVRAAESEAGLSGDRPRYLGSATRRIARGPDLDEVVTGLRRATVSAFADHVLVPPRDTTADAAERSRRRAVLRRYRAGRSSDAAQRDTAWMQPTSSSSIAGPRSNRARYGRTVPSHRYWPNPDSVRGHAPGPHRARRTAGRQRRGGIGDRPTGDSRPTAWPSTASQAAGRRPACTSSTTP